MPPWRNWTLRRGCHRYEVNLQTSVNDDGRLARSRVFIRRHLAIILQCLITRWRSSWTAGRQLPERYVNRCLWDCLLLPLNFPHFHLINFCCDFYGSASTACAVFLTQAFAPHPLITLWGRDLSHPHAVTHHTPRLWLVTFSDRDLSHSETWLVTLSGHDLSHSQVVASHMIKLRLIIYRGNTVYLYKSSVSEIFAVIGRCHWNGWSIFCRTNSKLHTFI